MVYVAREFIPWLLSGLIMCAIAVAGQFDLMRKLWVDRQQSQYRRNPVRAIASYGAIGLWFYCPNPVRGLLGIRPAGSPLKGFPCEAIEDFA